MNTGQLLVSLSGLPSGSALAHLMAIQTGTGTGETIYVERAFAAITEQRHVFVQRRNPAAGVKQQPSSESVRSHSTSKNAYSVNKQNAIAVLTVTPSGSVLSTSSAVVIHRSKSSR